LYTAGGLLVAAVLFGGGGSPAPRPELVVELAALLALVIWSWLAARERRDDAVTRDRGIIAIAALIAAVPLVQLIPLPPVIWHHLAGREAEFESLRLIGRQNAWMPLSLAPAVTLASALSLIPPLAMLWMVARLNNDDRLALLGLLGALGLVSAVVGVLQVISGNANLLRFYNVTSLGFATGFQANRNAQADVLSIAAMALACWAMSRNKIAHSRGGKALLVLFLVAFAFSVVLTGSRAGTALLIVPAIVCLLALVDIRAISRRRLVTGIVAALVVLGGTGVVLSHNDRFAKTLSRFGGGEARRPEVWADTMFAIRQYWPIGTGLGTFQPVFNSAERLEYVGPTFANRAHNDYLEYLLEAGIVAPIVLIVLAVFFLIRVGRLFRSPRGRQSRLQGLFLGGAFAVLLLHSIVDYPMRSMALAVMAGLFGGLLGAKIDSAGFRGRSKGQG
jgi:O-antigen ligase